MEKQWSTNMGRKSKIHRKRNSVKKDRGNGVGKLRKRIQQRIKKRGRPKGSKNKKTIGVIGKTGKKRGRPKGSKNKNYYTQSAKPKSPSWLGEDYKAPPSYKIIGYCPHCNTILSTKDLVSKFVFICPCGKKDRTKKLKNMYNNKETENKTHKEWMEDVLNAEHHDMPELKDDMGDIKLAE